MNKPVEPRLSRIFRILPYLLFLILVPLSHAEEKSKALPPQAEQVQVIKDHNGWLETVNKGVGKDVPPYVRVFRTKKGLLFQIKEFKKIRNRMTMAKAKNLEKALGNVDLNSNMVLGIMSFPTDNYSISINKIEKKYDKIEVDLNYSHQKYSYRILPSLKIFFHFLVIEKNNFPVVLKATGLTSKQNEVKPNSLKTISGKLVLFENERFSLGLVVTEEYKKYIYYIRDPEWIKKLTPDIGKVVEAQGYVYKEQGSVFEAEIKIEEIVKIK